MCSGISAMVDLHKHWQHVSAIVSWVVELSGLRAISVLSSTSDFSPCIYARNYISYACNTIVYIYLTNVKNDRTSTIYKVTWMNISDASLRSSLSNMPTATSCLKSKKWKNFTIFKATRMNSKHSSPWKFYQIKLGSIQRAFGHSKDILKPLQQIRGNDNADS